MDFLIQKVYAAGINNTAATASVSFDKLLKNILDNVATPIIYLLVALAVVYFLWGMLTFIQNAEAPDKREEGYKHMIWGIIGLFIMLSAKGIVNLILSTLGLN